MRELSVSCTRTDLSLRTHWYPQKCKGSVAIWNISKVTEHFLVERRWVTSEQLYSLMFFTFMRTPKSNSFSCYENTRLLTEVIYYMISKKNKQTKKQQRFKSFPEYSSLNKFPIYSVPWWYSYNLNATQLNKPIQPLECIIEVIWLFMCCTLKWQFR